jgi:hypothetical protein
MTPTLETLTARFLARQISSPQTISSEEVQPHEIVTGFRAGAAATWRDATAAGRLLGDATAPAMPPEWGSYVAQAADSPLMPLCFGAVPQRVRDVQLKPAWGQPTGKLDGFGELRKWIAKSANSKAVSDRLLAGAMARTLGEFAQAETILAGIPATGPHETILANEIAALHWHRGEIAEARAKWADTRGVTDGGPAVMAFNLACCDWRLGDVAAAAAGFDAACRALPDSTGWNHLAGLATVACGGE